MCVVIAAHPGAAELLRRGIDHEGVRLILDLELRNAQLLAENRHLADNLYLRSAIGRQPPRH